MMIIHKNSVNRGLAAAWILLGIWSFYIGLTILMAYPGESESLFGDYFLLPITYVYERIILGFFSLFMARIIVKEKAHRTQYLFVFVGLMLIFTISRSVIQQGGALPILVLLPLIGVKKLRYCLLLFAISFLLFIAIKTSHYTNFPNTIASINGTGYLLALVSFLAHRPERASFTDLEIGQVFRLALLIGFIPILLGEYHL